MQALFLTPIVFTVGCFLAPEGIPPARPSPAPAPPAAVADAFPLPGSGLTITVSPGAETSLAKVLDEFSRITGQHLLIASDTCSGLERTPTGLNRSVEIPPQEVYVFVESLLGHNGYALAVLNDHEPRLLGVYGVEQHRRGGSLRDLAHFVPAEAIGGYARHPAVLVTTTVDLPSTDVRQLANSMRALITDNNTQQIVPVGNTNSMILVGYGATIAEQVAMLQRSDELSRIAAEKEERERAEERERRAMERAKAQQSEEVITPPK